MLLNLLPQILVEFLPAIVVARSADSPDEREHEPGLDELSNPVQVLLRYLHRLLIGQNM